MPTRNREAFLNGASRPRLRLFVGDDKLEIAKMLTIALQMNLFDAFA